ncbi:GlxA family transcriptional regulator [Stappia indica]|uniref:GlxA family transcriptional regulator n=1 Tax=Stappia indica TaxID=538381 RepID=UPI001CD1D2CD|nr:GlxA family transcriptional regulator [Stappia indica]MCA1298815.1 GlxA family transcriptional regulator [Stappia indica]
MKTIACMIFPRFQSLDVSGPLDVFSEVNTLLGPEKGYELLTIATRPDPVIASNGMKLVPDVVIGEDHKPFDMVIIAGGPEIPFGFDDAVALDWLRQIQPRCDRCCSICTGAFILGYAGLLDGKKATTHWLHTDRFRELFSNTLLEPEKIYVRSGNILTSAGVTAGIDLSLALVREDHGAEIALQVAKRLLVVAQRQGGQSQFSPLLTPAPADGSPMQKVIEYIHQNTHRRIQNAELATVAGMTIRTFSRYFSKEMKVTPLEYLELHRIEIAKMKLETTSRSMKEIAYECGFGSTENMRLAFMRRISIAPSNYRQLFTVNRTGSSQPRRG